MEEHVGINIPTFIYQPFTVVELIVIYLKGRKSDFQLNCYAAENIPLIVDSALHRKYNEFLFFRTKNRGGGVLLSSTT